MPPPRRTPRGPHASALRAALVCAFAVAAAAPPRASGAETARELAGPSGPGLARLLGPHAARAFAPRSGRPNALVAVRDDAAARALGLEPLGGGLARLRGGADDVARFGAAHPELRVEIGPVLRPTNDRAAARVLATAGRAAGGVDGRGVLVGVADTGLDVLHADMRDPTTGASRVAWLLDLSMPPQGLHPDLEERFGVRDDAGVVVKGAVLTGADADALVARGARPPRDVVGHGTHVMGTAAGAGGSTGTYTGMAPGAGLVYVRITREDDDAIENDDLVRAVDFMFDRADAEAKPIVVNLSLGSDFGPHDGSALWERAIVRHVGPERPGHVVVAAAGNSGSIVESPVHQSVRVPEDGRMRVPVRTRGATNGAVQIWVGKAPGADLRVGLDGPDGTWIAPVADGEQAGKAERAYAAGIVHGSRVPDSPIPEGSASAAVVWAGAFPEGPYHVVLEGRGAADLYVQGVGDASPGARGSVSFELGVREGTVNLPATHPDVIGVGCTVSRARWSSATGTRVSVAVPLLDPTGTLPDPEGRGRAPVEGEVCWFSSAGPTTTGVAKPDVAAPGAFIVSSMSAGAPPVCDDDASCRASIFRNPTCPPGRLGTDDSCMQVDADHAVSVGTSMSSPVVAGVVALLLQKAPRLTQPEVRALLQGGAHKFAVDAPFPEQAGPGEVDVVGSLQALDQRERPRFVPPSLATSWLVPSRGFVPADGATGVTVLLELRGPDGVLRADAFEPARLVADVRVDGRSVAPPPIERRGPGVYVYTWAVPGGSGLGGGHATFGATFDGAPVVAPRVLPIAVDVWSSTYAGDAVGGCAIGARPLGADLGRGAVGLALALGLARRRARLTSRRR